MQRILIIASLLAVAFSMGAYAEEKELTVPLPSKHCTAEQYTQAAGENIVSVKKNEQMPDTLDLTFKSDMDYANALQKMAKAGCLELKRE
jgi:hypothetical protein